MQTLKQILESTGARLYAQRYCDPKADAQENLTGRTHYVDDSSLRFHKSRILNAHTLADGAFYYVITSDALDWDNTRRGFRYVLFDVFGTVVDRLPLEESFKTSDKATKALYAYFKNLNVIDYYIGRLQQRATRATNELAALNDALVILESLETKNAA